MTKALACREMKLPSPPPSPRGLGEGECSIQRIFFFTLAHFVGEGRVKANWVVPNFTKRTKHILSMVEGHEEKRSRAKHAKLRKSEYRNLKQTMRQTNPKYQIIQTSESARFEVFFFSSFEFVSNFGFRASSFNFLGDPFDVAQDMLGASNIRESRCKGIHT